jgi:tetratricopeptide (TPR) repeat protein
MRIVWIFTLAASLFAQENPLAPALKALDEGRFEAAVELLTKAVAADPADVSAHFNLALAYSLLDKDAQAIPEYRKVLELDPDIYEAHINLGQVLLRAKDPAAAIPHLRRAATEKPADFRASYYLAEALAETGQLAEAIPAYTSAVSIDPNSANAEFGLGRTLARLGRRIEAGPHYRKAVALDPKLKSFLLELATLHEQQKEFPEALSLYREFPEDPAALERIGLLSLQLNRFDDAAAALEASVRVSPTPANRLALAQAYVKLDQLPKAEPLLAQLATVERDNFDLRMLYARVLRDQRKLTEAAIQFQDATRIRPDAAPAWSELAGMLILIEQYPQAINALDRVKALGAENAGHMFFRATTLDRLRLQKEALEYYKKFLENSTTNPDQEFQARQRIRVLELELGKR